MLKRLDKLFDWIWDVAEPIAGTCPVCALGRGILIGAILAAIEVAILKALL